MRNRRGAPAADSCYFSTMLRRFRWVLIALGALGIFGGGASIFSRPEHETLYSAEPPLVTCHPTGCVALYTLNIGNSGWGAQESVVVRLHSAPLQRQLLAPQVTNFGVVPRRAQVREEEGIRTYELGRMEPRARVEMRIALACAHRNDVPPWSDLLAGVRAARGDIRAGDAAVVETGRAFFALSGCAGLLH